MVNKRIMRKTVFDCSLIELPRIQNRSVSLTPINNYKDIPFEAKRIFYVYDIPGGVIRGTHAHKECHEFLIAGSGSFEVHLDDGKDKKIVMLNQPYKGLHIPPGIWASETNFSSGAMCLVFASHEYEEDDYIRDYNSYLDYIRTSKSDLP